MKHSIPFIPKIYSLVSAWAILLALSPTALAAFNPNDDIFPPASAATNAITFDGRGFVINGKRTFIMSGSVHYARVPRENWRDILLKLKRAGFNTVETYVFWNYHEAKEGNFDFTTDSRDIGAFLDTAKEVGLYAIVRVGPYSCAEWENGGFPNWLLFKPGLEVRKNNVPYLKAVDAWMNQLLPIVSARQIHKGGNVILVQLENELPTDGWRHWGTDSDSDGYLQHLLNLAQKNGLEVPMFFSGLHHGHEPAPETPVDSTKRKSPWMSTELWTVWFDRYGNSGKDLAKGERSTWQVLSEGGNGFNLYMAYGGTTFGFFNFNDDRHFGDNREKGAATYDYGTLIGQAGETRILYTRLKRLGYFAETFSPILADSTNSTDQHQDFARGATITARTAPEGTLVFLENKNGGETNAVLKNGLSVKLAGGEIVGFAKDIPLVPRATIAEADTRILGIISQDGITTIVCYGETNNVGQLIFSAEDSASAQTVTDANFNFDSRPNPTLKFNFPATGVGEEMLTFNGRKVRVLVMDKEVADQTWFMDASTGRKIVVGSPYLGEFAMAASGKISATVDYPWNDSVPKALTVFDGSVQKVDMSDPDLENPSNTLTLSKWKIHPDNAPLARKFSDCDWFALPDGNPPEMGQDGDNSPFAWYHTRLTNSAPITSLAFKRIGDRATFFVDGKFAAAYDFKKDKKPEVQIQVPAGMHDLMVFVAHAGRTKFAGYVGAINRLEWQKGLRGPVTANGTNDVLVLNWKMRGGIDPENPQMKWSSARPKNGSPAYFQTSFNLQSAPEPGATYRFHTDGLSFGCIWLNGHNLGRYPEIVKDCPGLWLPVCWMKRGENMLVIYDEQGRSPEKTYVQLEKAASRHSISFTLEN